MFEDFSVDSSDPARFRVCILVSPGVQPMAEEDIRAGAVPETASVQQPVVVSESFNLYEFERHLEECCSLAGT